MRINEIRKAVFRIIEKYTHIEIKLDTLLRDDAGLDSMERLEICNDIESEFNLIIEDSELFTPKVENATAGEIVEMVIAKLKEQDAQQKEVLEEETEEQTEEVPGEILEHIVDKPIKDSLKMIKVYRKDGIVYVIVAFDKSTEKYRFVNLTKNHICKCQFNTIDDAMKDISKREEVFSWDIVPVQDAVPDNLSQNIKSIAEEYLHSRIKVWCKNHNFWETDKLSITPSGDFVDKRLRIHSRLTHTAYVTLDDAIEAVRTTLAKLLENKEFELEKLKQDAFLTEKLRELSRTQEQIAKDSVYNKDF